VASGLWVEAMSVETVPLQDVLDFLEREAVADTDALGVGIHGQGMRKAAERIRERFSRPPATHPPIDPCPFCGDKGPEIAMDDFAGQSAPEYWVECNCCGAHGPQARIGCRWDEFEDLTGTELIARLEREAITMWNGAIARAEASEEE